MTHMLVAPSRAFACLASSRWASLRPRLRLAALALALALPACSDPQSGGQIGGEKVSGCYEVTGTVIALDEVSPLGFSAADALATNIEGDRTETMLWAKGGDTVLSLGVIHGGGETRFVESEYRAYGGDAEPAMDPCAAAIEIDIDVSFATADGAFAESWSGIVRAEAADRAAFWYDLDLGALAGTYQVTEVDPAEFDEIEASASILFQSGDASGSLTGQAITVDEGGGLDSSASAMRFDIATF